MTQGYTKSPLQTPRKGLFTHHKATKTIAPSAPPSSKDYLQGQQGAQWVTAGFDEIHQQEHLCHDHRMNPPAQDDTRPKRWRTSVLEYLRITESTVIIFPWNKLFTKGNVLRDADRWFETLGIFVHGLSMLKNVRMTPIKSQLFSIRQFHLLIKCFRKHCMSCM